MDVATRSSRLAAARLVSEGSDLATIVIAGPLHEMNAFPIPEC